MNFDRWFWNDDTSAWSKRATRFLLIATVLALLAVLWWFVR